MVGTVNFADRIKIDSGVEASKDESIKTRRTGRSGGPRNSSTGRREGRVSRRRKPPPKTKSRSLSPERRSRGSKALPGRTKSRSLSPQQRPNKGLTSRRDLIKGLSNRDLIKECSRRDLLKCPGQKRTGRRSTRCLGVEDTRKRSHSLKNMCDKPRLPAPKLERTVSRSLSPDHARKSRDLYKGGSSRFSTYMDSFKENAPLAKNEDLRSQLVKMQSYRRQSALVQNIHKALEAEQDKPESIHKDLHLNDKAVEMLTNSSRQEEEKKHEDKKKSSKGAIHKVAKKVVRKHHPKKKKQPEGAKMEREEPGMEAEGEEPVVKTQYIYKLETGQMADLASLEFVGY